MAFISFQPKDKFKTLLYNGNGSTQNITGVGFKPDLTWIKNRNSSAHDHFLFDANRGVQKRIQSNTTAAEATVSGLTAFNTDGFSLGSSDGMNENSIKFVAWNWKASPTSSSNNDGSVASTVCVDATAGCSIVKYTNPSSGSPFTVGHGLSAAPEFIIIKNLTSAQTWGVWHKSIGFGKYLRLDSTAAEAAANLVTATSNTTFSTYYDHHSAGNELVAYCFAPKRGFSKFGQYGGKNSTWGAYVPTGFQPAFILTKRYDSTGWWALHDHLRDGDEYNGGGRDDALFANTSDNESETSNYLNIMSNGFKLRTNNGNIGGSNGDDFFYAAFARFPFVSSTGIPGTAR